MENEEMKFVYIAHPIGGDIKNNLEKVVKIGRQIDITEPNVVPIAQYFFDCYCLDDNNPLERERGIKNDTAILRSGLISEVRLYGNTISGGMAAEIRLANEIGIKVVPMTAGTIRDFAKFAK